jgi:hypothetical protein
MHMYDIGTCKERRLASKVKCEQEFQPKARIRREAGHQQTEIERMSLQVLDAKTIKEAVSRNFTAESVDPRSWNEVSQANHQLRRSEVLHTSQSRC